MSGHKFMIIYCAQTQFLNDGGALQIHGNCPGAGMELLCLDNHTADLHSQSPVVAVSCGYSLQNWRFSSFISVSMAYKLVTSECPKKPWSIEAGPMPASDWGSEGMETLVVFFARSP